jgi:hypothetical protein
MCRRTGSPPNPVAHCRFAPNAVFGSIHRHGGFCPEWARRVHACTRLIVAAIKLRQQKWNSAGAWDEHHHAASDLLVDPVLWPDGI